MKKSLKRRRLEGKTDYSARLALLKAGKTRLVLRRSNKYIIAQLIVSEYAQDRVLAQAISSELLNKGWPSELQGSLKSRAASYLTGFLLVSKLNGSIAEAILDIGMHRNIHKSRLYAALKGALDAGLHVYGSADILPSMEMIEGDSKLHKVFKLIMEKLK